MCVLTLPCLAAVQPHPVCQPLVVLAEPLVHLAPVLVHSKGGAVLDVLRGSSRGRVGQGSCE
jgi:hypothetical protein